MPWNALVFQGILVCIHAGEQGYCIDVVAYGGHVLSLHV